MDPYSSPYVTSFLEVSMVLSIPPFPANQRPGWGSMKLFRAFGCTGLQIQSSGRTLPKTNMETPKWPCKDYSPFKGGYIGFHVGLGECN